MSVGVMSIVEEFERLKDVLFQELAALESRNDVVFVPSQPQNEPEEVRQEYYDEYHTLEARVLTQCEMHFLVTEAFDFDSTGGFDSWTDEP